MNRYLLIILILLTSTVYGANDTITVAASGGDYTTLRAAIEAGHTVAAGDTLFIEISLTDMEAPGHFDWDDITYSTPGDTSSVVYIKTVGLARHSGVWCDTCYVLDLNGTFIDVEDNFFIVDGLQIIAQGSNDYFIWSAVSSPGYFRWWNCIFDSDDRTIYPFNQPIDHEVRNCLIIDTIGPSGGAGFIELGASDDADSIYVSNCTFVGSSIHSTDVGWTINSHAGMEGALEIYNCLFYNLNSYIFDPFGVDYGHYDTLDYCASDTSTTYATPDGEGSSIRVSQTFTFLDAANFDFRLAAGDAGAKGHGVDMSSGHRYTFSTDVEGETRTDWSIGFSEPPAGEEEEDFPSRRRKLLTGDTR